MVCVLEDMPDVRSKGGTAAAPNARLEVLPHTPCLADEKVQQGARRREEPDNRDHLPGQIGP